MLTTGSWDWCPGRAENRCLRGADYRGSRTDAGSILCLTPGVGNGGGDYCLLCSIGVYRMKCFMIKAILGKPFKLRDGFPATYRAWHSAEALAVDARQSFCSRCLPGVPTLTISSKAGSGWGMEPSIPLTHGGVQKGGCFNPAAPHPTTRLVPLTYKVRPLPLSSP